MRLDPRLALLLLPVVGSTCGGPRERENHSLLALALFPAPLVRQSVPLTQALGEVGSYVQHGYALFGVELRLRKGDEPRVSINLPAGSTLEDALHQVFEQLPGYEYEIVSAHLINIYPRGAKQDPTDLLNMRVARFDVVDTTPGEVISAPERFVPPLRLLLHPGSGFLGGLSGGPHNLTLHLQNVSLRQILNAASEATERFPAELSPLGWVYSFQPRPDLPAGGVHSWDSLLTAPRDWKVYARQAGAKP